MGKCCLGMGFGKVDCLLDAKFNARSNAAPMANAWILVAIGRDICTREM